MMLSKPKSLLVIIPTTLGMLFLVLASAIMVVKTSDTAVSNNSNFRATAGVDTVELSLTPPSQEFVYEEDKFFSASILLQSGNKPVNAVDVIIKFDPSLVFVDPKIIPGNLLEHYPVRRVDNKTGQIVISALNFNPKIASGFLATFQFRPLGKGRVDFTFDFVPSSNLDSNVVGSVTDSDILTKVEGTYYSFR